MEEEEEEKVVMRKMNVLLRNRWVDSWVWPLVSAENTRCDGVSKDRTVRGLSSRSREQSARGKGAYERCIAQGPWATRRKDCDTGGEEEEENAK